MQCLYPVLIEGQFTFDIVPCGKCIVCREKRIKEWYIRLLCEMTYSDQCYCLTLTYSDDNLPEDTDLNHHDVQCYLKRLRKGLDGSFHYYVAGEYGERGGRAHYHMLLFYKGNDEKFLDKAKDKWQLGRVHTDMMSAQAIRYTLDYLQKSMSKHAKKHIVQPYQKMSKGLGLEYVKKHEKVLADKKYLEFNGVRFAMPRYFRKKSELIDSSIFEAYQKAIAEIRAIDKNYLNKGLISYREKAEQTKMNIIARKKLKRGSL